MLGEIYLAYDEFLVNTNNWDFNDPSNDLWYSHEIGGLEGALIEQAAYYELSHGKCVPIVSIANQETILRYQNRL